MAARIPLLERPTTDATNRRENASEPLTPRHHVIDQQPLVSRIERTQLEATVAALERELLESERRRQDVIDQYERVLERRESDDDTTSATNARVSNGLRRLLEFGRR